uniref:Uncharacterized protein ycf53 n=2 Tax=Pyropia yezoensis TaxID=2788 RepID=YCF53_PYRYE|nr:hypothetical protein 238 [Neopyropia yezoensis]Q1XDT5.1 RecName: Full=Uncharacterized protein ycf53 [Neopyropia yezoensis]AGH27526.1 hypothetical protein 238 [Neopyropia yezoensis]QFZ66862.1 hypothetical protein PyyePp016 [Neopyropia yezoensis]BAE92326.1 unnamed protein product [Neopyropia yezoensis]
MPNQIRAQLLELNKNTKSNNVKQQLEIIENINSNDSIELKDLADLFFERITGPNYKSNCVDGLIYEKLLNSKNQEIVKFASNLCPDGIVPLRSAQQMNYKDLQMLLTHRDLLKADQLTQQKLIQLAGVNAQTRNWLYFTDIKKIPAQDLQTIDKLWHTHSKGKFGLFVQRQIWLSVGKDWGKFWQKIGWEVDRIPCRYPEEFQWNSHGPRGHLPLFNQLRGVQVLSALFTHKAWENY